MSKSKLETHLPTTGSLTRRELLALFGYGVAGITLTGCGGGGSPGNSGGVIFTPSRTEPVGDLANQITQYSRSIDNFSQYLSGNSDAIQGYFNVRNTTKSIVIGGRATNPDLYEIIADTIGSYIMLRTLYERVCDALLELDNAGFLADQVTTSNKLRGTSSLSNPQWHAAMHLKLIKLQRVTLLLMRYHQTLGVKTFAKNIPDIQDENERLFMYGFYADTFNRWLDTLSIGQRIQVNPENRLDVSASFTAGQIPMELMKVGAIVDSLPLGPGYRQAFTAREAGNTESGYAKPVEIAEDSFFGAVLKPFEDIRKNGIYGAIQDLKHLGIASLSYGADQAIKLGERAPVVLNVIKNIANNTFTYVATELVKKGLTDLGKPILADIAECAVSGFTGASALVEIAGAAVVGETSLAAGAVGAATLGWAVPILAGAALLVLTAKSFESCLPKGNYEAFRNSETELAKELGIAPYTANTIAPATAECDQLSRAGVAQQKISSLDGSSPGAGMDVGTARTLLAGDPSQSTIRTFERTDAASLALLMDYASRHSDLTQPSVNGNVLCLYASDFAALIRREAGSMRATIPAITSAQLLCTSPGFAPSRTNDPMDITQTNFPPLLPVTNGFGLGVNANVH